MDSQGVCRPLQPLRFIAFISNESFPKVGCRVRVRVNYSAEGLGLQKLYTTWFLPSYRLVEEQTMCILSQGFFIFCFLYLCTKISVDSDVFPGEV